MNFHLARTAPAWHRSTACCYGLLIAVIMLTAGTHEAYGDRPMTAKEFSKAQLKEVVTNYFKEKSDFSQGDLITQADAKAIMAQLNQVGWKVSDADQIVNRLLPPGHIVAKTFASRRGVRFMRKVDRFELIYDRLHRTAELPGGKALVRDIVKLPNGEIYAKMKPVPGTPNFTELLPKGINGKPPEATNFEKPTGYIYTSQQLTKRLEESRQRDFPN